MKGLSQEALDRASFELQRHFGREGSIYGIKACEEIARIALTAYGTVPEVTPTEGAAAILKAIDKEIRASMDRRDMNSDK